MRKWALRAAVLLAVVAAVVLSKRTWLAPRPLPVRVVEADRGVVESTVTNSKAGTVKARRRAGISPETAGVVVEIPARKGARVRRGDVLVRLGDASQRAALGLAEKAVQSAEALYARACIASERARRELDRNRNLVEQGIVSTDVVDQLESAFDLAQASCRAGLAEIEKAQASVRVARVDLDKTVVLAPFDGVIAEADIELGEWVTPAVPMVPVPAVVDLIDTSSVYVSAPMDEVDLARIRTDQRAKVTLDPWPGRSFAGRVTAVAPYVLDVEKQNRTVEVEVELEDAAFSAGLLPGTSADVEVVLDAREDVLRLPTSCFLEGNRILALEDGVLVEKELEIGLRNWQWTEVLSGLQPGTRVVSSLDRAEVKSGARAIEVRANEAGRPQS